MIETLISIAIAFWAAIGATNFPEINISYIHSDKHVASILWPLEDNTCQLRIYDTFYEIDSYMQQEAITHEIGHCLGLDHIDQPGVMNAHLSDLTAETGADVWEYYHVHPLPLLTRIPEISS